MKYPKDLENRYRAGILLFIFGLLLLGFRLFKFENDRLYANIAVFTSRGVNGYLEALFIGLLFVLGLATIIDTNRSFNRFLLNFAKIMNDAEGGEISLEELASSLGYGDPERTSIIEKYLSNNNVLEELSEKLNQKLVYDKDRKRLLIMKQMEITETVREPNEPLFHENEETITRIPEEKLEKPPTGEESDEETVAAPQSGELVPDLGASGDIDMEETYYREEEPDIPLPVDEKYFLTKLEEILGTKAEDFEKTTRQKEESTEETDEETQVYF